MKQKGFTIIELVAITVATVLVGFVVFTQFNSIQATNRDEKRRTAINSLHYNLEDIFFATNKHYPEQITKDTLSGIDSNILKDPNGVLIGEGDSEYRYEPINCENSQCKGYTLRADLEQESDYIKRNTEL